MEEFADHLSFLDATKERLKDIDKQYDVVVAYYDVMGEFSIDYPEIDRAAFQTLRPDYQAFKVRPGDHVAG